MIGEETAERLVHEPPESIRDAWKDGEVELERLQEAFMDEAERMAVDPDGDTDLMAVQGEISSGKTWLIAALAEEYRSRGHTVSVLVPQKHNRRDVINRLREFNVPASEMPSREDLCVWEEWLDSVERVDEKTCSSNGCERFPSSDVQMQSVRARAKNIREQDEEETVPSGPIDEKDLENLSAGVGSGTCPAYLSLEVGRASDVCVATYAKALSTDSSDNPLEADVLLLDEGHDIAADMSVVEDEMDVPEVLEAIRSIVEQTKGNREIAESRRELERFADALEEWRSEGDEEDKYLSPGDLLDEAPDPSDCEEALESVEEELLVWMEHRLEDEDASERREAYRDLRPVRRCLSMLRGFKHGHRDFVRVRYESRDSVVDSLRFRKVENETEGCNPEDVREEWSERGAPPAVSDRWGGLLDRHIGGLMRYVVPGGGRDGPGRPLLPLEVLRDRLGADMVYTFSATHNELSDPVRSPDEMRSTRHQVLVAEPNLRSEGDEKEEYSGKDSIDGETPWFRRIIQEAQSETGATLVAVPINKRNAEKWRGLPVEEFEVPDGDGGEKKVPYLVPNSRGAHGSKDFEGMPVDVVLCGCQVQAPAETASRVMDWWEMLAPHYDDPSEVLDASWRLLAQHAVSPTLQAAGRFREEATTLLFEIPELVELAGFEQTSASVDEDGFVSEFLRRFGDEKDEHRRKRIRRDAKYTVKRLEEDETKAPTQEQCLKVYQTLCGVSEKEAAAAFNIALQEDIVEYSLRQKRFRLPEE